ncbi:hypothetical protein Tco_0446164 [Tanacetum coccineum]
MQGGRILGCLCVRLEKKQQGDDVASWWPWNVFEPTPEPVKWLPFTNRNSDEAQTSGPWVALVHKGRFHVVFCTNLALSDSFLPSILLLVVIVVTVVIVMVISVVVVVAIVGVVVVVVGSSVPSINKLSLVILVLPKQQQHYQQLVAGWHPESWLVLQMLMIQRKILEFKTSRDGNNGMSDPIGGLVFLDTKVLRRSDGSLRIHIEQRIAAMMGYRGGSGG